MKILASSLLLVCLAARADLDDLEFLEKLKAPSGGGGAVTFVVASTPTRATGSQTTATNSITIGSTMSGGYIVLGMGWYRQDDSPVSGVTFNGSAMTFLAITNDVSNAGAIMYGRAVGSLAAGTYEAIVTFGGVAALEWSLGLTAVNGANQSSQSGTPAMMTSGGTTTPSVNVTSAVNELVIDTLMTYNGATHTGDQTENWDAGASANTTSASSREAGAASVTMSWVLSGSQPATLIGFPIKP